MNWVEPEGPKHLKRLYKPNPRARDLRVPLKGTVRVLYGYYKGVLRILVAEFIRPKKVLSALNCLGFGVPYFKTFLLKEPL